MSLEQVMNSEAEAVKAAEALASDNEVRVVDPGQNVTEVRTFTADDLAKARQQEKDKQYKQIEAQKEQISLLRKERDERLAAEKQRHEADEAARREAEEAARKKAEEEMDLRQLMDRRQQEWESQMENERAERERAFQLLERERQFAELSSYRNNAISQASDDIMPELLDLVTGNTPEEIDASINSLRDRTAKILESAQSAMQETRRNLVGSRVTAPAVGPMDTNSDNKTFTADDLRNMSMDDYIKHRHQLIGNNPSQRGLFG